MKTSLLGLAALLLAVFLAAPAPAAKKAGVTLRDTAFVGAQPVVLNGIALRERFFVDVYVAGLYLTERTTDPAAILADEAPRLMTMHFVHDVAARKINAAWLKGLKDNAAPASPELTAKFGMLTAMMDDIEDGETMSFAYEPGTGTTVTVKGVNKGVIPGKDFADAVLATWIGPNPGPGKDFKEALLGR